jgi:periplasmic protein TonB
VSRPGPGRHSKSAVPLGRTAGIVIAIHLLIGLGVYALAQTEVGQRMIKQYKVSLQPEQKQAKKDPPKKADEPPKPPPPPMEAPPAVAAAPVPSVGAGPQIGGGGGLTYGGKFKAPTGGGGALGAFHASVQRRFRQYYKEPNQDFSGAEMEFEIGSEGAVRSYRLVRSSGSPLNDAALMEAAAKLQKDGVAPPPEGQARRVQVKVTPY